MDRESVDRPSSDQHRYSRYSRSQESGLFRFSSAAWENFKPLVILVFLALLIAIGTLGVFLFNSSKFVNGVQIGEVDVSGMTVEQAATALSDHYIPNIDATKVYVFADEKSRDSADLELQQIEADAQAEQLSFEEAKANKKLWIASAGEIGAFLPAMEIAKAAKEQSDDSGLFARLGLGASDVRVPVHLSFDGGYLEDFVEEINDALGTPVDDYSLEIHDGEIYIDKGHKGVLMNTDEFGNAMSELLLQDDSPTVSYVANLSKVDYDVTKKKAKRAKRAIEKLVPKSVEFKCGEASMRVSRSSLMNWITTEKEYGDNGWILKARFDSALAAPEITASMNKAKDGKFASVSITDDSGAIKVSTNMMLDLYDLDSALSDLDNRVFGTYNSGGEIGDAPENVEIEMSVISSSSDFSLEDALAHGIVVGFSSYTTKYANTASTVNRMNNIHLAAEKLNNSIAKANGGTWSFNEVAGPATAEEGFLEANVIDRNTMTTGVGGGICQVATTVFNAVYEAGMPISERHNHTLYTSSYPAGRDAAIAYPFLDLKWRNDTDSDILIVTSYTDYSVTVMLVGVDPGRKVETETGDWEEGDKYKTVYEVDDTLSKDASYIKQNGIDGTTISVTRTSYGPDGSVLSQDTFPSAYSATDRVIAYGKKSNMSDLKDKYEKKPKKKKSGNKEEQTE